MMSERIVALETNEEQRNPRPAAHPQQWRTLWSEMNPELLALIFSRIKPLDLMVRTVPLVCRSWREAAAEPDCWAHIDLELWCRRVSNSAAIDAAVRKLARRSKGTLRSLSLYKISNNGFFYACSSGSFLRVLKMPMSEVTDQMVEKHIESLSMLTVLDISYCLKITSKSIELLGNWCKNLAEFRRNMPPPHNEINNGAVGNVDELEAIAVANTMHGVEHLELAYGRFSSHGLEPILSNCRALRVLDIRGCWNVKLEGDTEYKCYSIRSFNPPWENDYDENDFSGDDGDSNDYEEEEEEDSDAAFVDVDTSDDDSNDDGYD